MRRDPDRLAMTFLHRELAIQIKQSTPIQFLDSQTKIVGGGKERENPSCPHGALDVATSSCTSTRHDRVISQAL
jgi:hypothetical protein